MQVVYGNEATFQMMTFGVPSASTFDYFQEKSRSFDLNVSNTALLKVNEVQDFYKGISLDAALDALRAAKSSLGSLEIPDMILALTSLEELQAPPDAMVPWIMANPTVREMYLNNECEGYGERYVDYYADALGTNHALYRAAVHGLWRENKDGEYQCEIFGDVLADESLQIDMREQLEIMQTWDELEYFLAQRGADPTSPFGNKL